jgi:hypothetical protein
MAKAKKQVQTLIKWSEDDWGTALWEAQSLTAACDNASDNLVDALLKRSRKFVELETHAKKNNQKDKLPDIYDSFGKPDTFTKSMWRTIGDPAANDALAKHKSNLPASQEALKTLARHHKKLPDLIASKKLTRNSSVADVRGVVGEGQPNPKKKEDEARVIGVAELLGKAISAVLTDKKYDGVYVALPADANEVYEQIKKLIPQKRLLSIGKRLRLGAEIPHSPLAEWERRNLKVLMREEAKSTKSGKVSERLDNLRRSHENLQRQEAAEQAS